MPPKGPRAAAPRGPSPRGPSPRGPTPRGPSPAPGRGIGRGSPVAATPTPPPPLPAPSPPKEPARVASPPPELPPPPPPPPPVDEHKKLLQELMAKKMTAWDRMMDTKEGRTDGLDAFNKLSDEEVNLANKIFSKRRLQEFIDQKLQHFDQLIGETDKRQRGERVKKIQEIGESEMSLVKGVGPKSLFQELAEEASKAARMKGEEKEKEEKLAKQKADQAKEKDHKAAEEEKRKQVEEYPQGMARMLPPQMVMLPPRMPGLRPGAMPIGMPGMVHNVADLAMHQGQAPGTMGGMPPEALSAMQQGHNLPFGAYMTGMYNTMPPMGFPHYPMIPHVPPEYKPCTLPHVVVTAQEAKKEGPVEAKETKSKSSREPGDSSIDQNLKLLAQLESARIVLQNRPLGSESSTADEFRNRLRKINRLQMKVVDDILGSKCDINLFDFMPELQPQKPEKLEKKKSEESSTESEEKEEEVEKEPRIKESKRFLTLYVPQDSEADVKVVPAPPSRADSPRRGNVCTGTSKLCSANKQPHPEDTRGRSKSVITTFDVIQMADPAVNYTYYGPSRAQPDIPRYEQQAEFYTDGAPHYHNQPPLAQSAPQEVFYDTMPGRETPLSFPQTNYAAQNPQYFAQQHHSPVEFDIVLRGNWSYPENVGNGGFSGDIYGANASQLIADGNEPGLLPNIIIPGGRPEVAVQTEAALKKPVRQQGQQVDTTGTAQPAQARAMQVTAAVQVSATQLPPQQTPAQEATKQGSLKDDRLAKVCQDGLLKIATSVDGILNSLHSLPSDRPQRTQQRRYRDEDYDDEDSSYSDSDSYSDYDDPPPRRQKGRNGSRSPERRRKKPENKKSSSIFSWLYESVCKTTPSSKEENRGDARLIQVANRIRELVQKVVYASNEVIEARKAIQQSGMLGQEGTQNVFTAEDKLWNLINLESQLADGLAQYRLLDTSSNKAYCDSLEQAEDKIRQLIEVETKLAGEIGAWRQMTKQGPLSSSYTRTMVNRRPDSDYSIPTSAAPSGVISASWNFGRRTN